MQNTTNTNEWINWIEEAISKEYFRFYDQNHFSNLQKIVNFNSLSWNDKCNLAYQLACAVSCLHNEGIVHRDLHSSNVLVHQNTVKLSDFGLSKRIESSSNSQSKLFGIIPYVDPIRFSGRRKNKNSTPLCSSTEKSDIYSVGVLFWEISSGQPPFCTEGEQYDIDLALEISQGLREEPIPNTPEDYIKIYTECWNGEPDNRPTINQVVERLKSITTITNITIKDYETGLNLQSKSTDGQKFNQINVDTPSNIDNSLHGEMSQFIENFGLMNTKEIYKVPENNKTKPNKNYQTGLHLQSKPQIFNKINADTSGEMSLIIENFVISDTKEIVSTALLTNENISSEKNLIVDDIAANSGNSVAQHSLGHIYRNGDGVSKDYDKAFELFKQSAEGGNLDGIVALGYCYNNGIGVSINKKKAFELYQQAANLQHNLAQNNLALMYKNGDVVSRDYGKAIELFQQSANSGNSLAQRNLAYMYKNGEGMDKNYNKAFELFKKSAEGGDSDGMMNLGYFYSRGIGTSVDKKRAFELYQQAANLGHSMAQNNLALMYKNGDGIGKDYYKAIELYQQAANSGNSLAQYNLGAMYENGIGVNKDYNKAFKLFQKSAEGGNSDGIVKLGYYYNNGIGTSVNIKKAFELYQQAANLGNDMAQNNLGNMYENGEGVKQDYGKAMELYHKAANSGNSLAQFNLGYMYKKGRGIKKDINQAIYWFDKSAKQGYQDAQNQLKKLRK
ncbi:hypothetical protein RIR_jg12181.t1 [Rhizophagus irregularis DAOM 181602=DAOM 197198]|nr:hypothetical protein RIR_jg12181.t1 [Rhizophagus irregularis DAOM 181602=DAOM 197198]